MQRFQVGKPPTSFAIEQGRQKQAMMTDTVDPSEAFYPTVPVISLELTNRCNLKCPYCGNSELTRKSGYIEWKLLEKLVEESANGHHDIAWLHGTGEPMLWDRLEDVIRLIKKNDAGEASFGTNGTLLHEHRIKSLLDAGLSSIYVSIDSLDPEIYKNTRGAKLSKVINNVQNLISIVPSDFKIIIALMDHKDQRLGKESILEFYSTFGVAENINLNLVKNVIFPSAPQDFRVDQVKSPSCTSPVNFFTIVSDGRVSICCVDQDVLHSIGDTNTQTIDEIWFDRRNQETFRNIATGMPRCPDVCTKNCHLQERNLDPAKVQLDPAITLGFDAAMDMVHTAFLAGELERAAEMLKILSARNSQSRKVAYFTKILRSMNI